MIDASELLRHAFKASETKGTAIAGRAAGERAGTEAAGNLSRDVLAIDREAAAPLKGSAAAPIQRFQLPDEPRALRQALADKATFRGAPGDNYMTPLLEQAGFDGLPSVESPSAIDAAVQRGERELLRGVSDRAYGEQFRGGPLFIGAKNANGSAIWATYGADKAQIASRYRSGRGEVLRMTLKPDARVVDYSEITAMLKAEKQAAIEAGTAARSQAMAEAERAGSPEEAQRLKLAAQAAQEERGTRNGFRFGDLGRYATLKGFDAIDMPTTGFMAILNRTALRVQARDPAVGLARRG